MAYGESRPPPARSRVRSSARGWASRRCSTGASPPTPAPSSPTSTPTCPSIPIRYEGRTAWQITVPEPLVGGGRTAPRASSSTSASGLPPGRGALERRRRGERHTHRERCACGGAIDRSVCSACGPRSRSRLVPLERALPAVTLPAAVTGARRLAAEVPLLAPGARLAAPGLCARRHHGRCQRRRDGPLHGGPASPGSSTRSRSCSPTAAASTASASSAAGGAATRRARTTPSTRTRSRRRAVRTSGLTEGALAGSPARLVLGLPDWPHLYVTTGADRHVSVSVAGDLTRDELLRIAASLRTSAALASRPQRARPRPCPRPRVA